MFNDQDSILAVRAEQKSEPTAANGQIAESPSTSAAKEAERAVGGATPEFSSRHALAGRKGAHRVHQLIEEGRLYEQEHGLKSGRQRLRQLIELGKLYEQEHDLRPRTRTKRMRLSRTEREELLSTLLRCLQRIAKPSYRADLARLVEALRQEPDRST
jgi:hypothetical protein